MKLPAVRFLALLALGVSLAAATAARADEIRLKDGSKIIGTIVGYEDGAFKVETSYGFATVRKDSIAEIVPVEPKKAAAAKVPSDDKAPEEIVEVPKPPARSGPMPKPEPTAKPTAAAAKLAPAVPVKATSLPPIAAAVSSSAPLAPAEPPAIVESVRGNLYVNQTYGFQMYRPPDWDVIAEARKALPDAVAALGTNDQTTLFVVGRDVAHDSIDAHATATEHAMQNVYENYRLVSSRRTTVAGLPAVEKRFQGATGGRDWSGTVLTLAHGDDIFTILAMTWADSDLIQIQENVISKTVASLRFDATH